MAACQARVEGFILVWGGYAPQLSRTPPQARRSHPVPYPWLFFWFVTLFLTPGPWLFQTNNQKNGRARKRCGVWPPPP